MNRYRLHEPRPEIPPPVYRAGQRLKHKFKYGADVTLIGTSMDVDGRVYWMCKPNWPTHLDHISYSLEYLEESYE